MRIRTERKSRLARWADRATTWSGSLGRTRLRSMAPFVALVVLAAACTSSATDGSTTTTPPAQAPTAAALMDQVFGGTQAVQDFAIHIDMAKQTDDGPVSFYHEVLDRAVADKGDPVNLAGGFTFTPTSSIETMASPPFSCAPSRTRILTSYRLPRR